MSFLVTTCLTDGPSTAFAIFHRIPVSQLNLARESGLTEHAVLGGLLAHFSDVECLGQGRLVQQTVRVETPAHQLVVVGRRHWHHHGLGGNVEGLLTPTILLHVGSPNWIGACDRALLIGPKSLRRVAIVEHGGGCT